MKHRNKIRIISYVNVIQNYTKGHKFAYTRGWIDGKGGRVKGVSTGEWVW